MTAGKNKEKKIGKKEKILLVLFPFWTPLIPPMGISCLKSFLQEHGRPVKTVDLNIEDQFKEIYNRYFDAMIKIVPENKRGNFHNVGKDVLQNHMMAYIHFSDAREYIELVKILISKTFFHEAADRDILPLNQVIKDFYTLLAEHFMDLLQREQPGVLGLSVYEGTLPASLFAAKRTKNTYPHIKIVMGGGIFAEQLSAGSPNWDFFLQKTPYIDKIIIGEGENLFFKYLKGELPESQRIYTLKDINMQTLDLSSAPLPDFSDFEIRSYPYLAAYTSRSCPFQCKFCSETVQWGKYRKKQARQIVKELEELYKKYESQLVLMGDSLLNPVITEMARELIKEDLSIYWDGYLRADKEVGDHDHTLLWRRAGFYRARLGIESGSPKILELMGKRTTPLQVKKAVSSLAFAGTKTTTYWVLGFPGETEQDFKETLDLITELRNDLYEAWCSPFYYYPTGQVNSNAWGNKNKLLYPENAKAMLMIQTWIQDCQPSREETYQRMYRFVQHCKHLGVPNPFSLHEIYEADQRWRKLHPNAVPSIVDFEKKGDYIDESRRVEKIFLAKTTMDHGGDFSF